MGKNYCDFGKLSGGVRFEVLAALTIKTIFWDKLPYGLVKFMFQKNVLGSLFDSEDGGSASL